MPDAPFPTLVSRLRDLADDASDGTTDADLLRRYSCERDPVAFEALVWRHARLVMGVCRRALRHHQDAEDAFQAVFLLLARKAHRIRRGAALPGWLHTTAVRVARRARSRRRPFPVPEVPERPIADPLPESAEALAILDEEVQRLPTRLRVTFVLCGLEDRSHADAAHELGCPKGTIDSRMRAAKRRLQVALSRRGVMMVPVAALTAIVPELAYSDAARQAADMGLGRTGNVSPSVAGLLASAGVSRWLLGLAALTLVAAGTLATLAGMAGPGDLPKLPKSKSEPPPAPRTSSASTRLSVATAPAWKWTTIGLPPEYMPKHEMDAATWLRHQYDLAVEARRKAGRPNIPPGIPAVAGNQFVYSHDSGFGQFGVPTEKEKDPTQSDSFWAIDTERSLVRAVVNLEVRKAWLVNFPDPRPAEQSAELLFNRTLSTSFTATSSHVHNVDELGILPPPRTPKGDPFPRTFGDLDEVVQFNGIGSCDRATGKVKTRMVGKSFGRTPNPLGATLHLGPPVQDGDYLYAHHESDRRVRLSALRWDPLLKHNRSVPPGDGKDLIAWDTELAAPQWSLSEDVYRRIHAIHLVKSGDLILCPTHLGRVVAVDAKSGQKKWTHEYAPLDAKRFPTFAPEWVVVSPAVAGDRYVYAPADFPELLCLNVADGKKVWSVKKGDGLYPAVVGGQVLVIGEKTIRSVNLKDSSERWRADLPGLPCGRGAVLGDTYLVPVSEPKTWKGMIAVVDLKAGTVIDVLKPEKDEPIGNLVVHKDYLISQTLTEIAVFPIKNRE